jgi:uncharacterized RDD family membrane protein YckC
LKKIHSLPEWLGMPDDAPNPYAPPAAELTDPLNGKPHQPHASKGLRFANLMIDQLASVGLSVLFFTAVDEVLTTPPSSLVDGLYTAAGYLFPTFYHFFNEICGGRGQSKLITGTRAEHVDGRALTVRGALTRSLCRLIPFEAFSFLGSGPGGWHDTITGTRVVNLRARAIPPKTSFPGMQPFTPPGVWRPAPPKAAPDTPPPHIPF